MGLVRPAGAGLSITNKQCNNEKFTKNKFVGHAVAYGRSMHPTTD